MTTTKNIHHKKMEKPETKEHEKIKNEIKSELTQSLMWDVKTTIQYDTF